MEKTHGKLTSEFVKWRLALKLTTKEKTEVALPHFLSIFTRHDINFIEKTCKFEGPLKK